MPKESDFTIRLSKAAKELNVGKDTIVELLAKKGFQIDSIPNTKLTAEMYALLVREFQGEKAVMDLVKRLENFYYKGGSVSVESTIKTSKVTTDKYIEEKTNTICKEEIREKEKSVVKVVKRKEEKNKKIEKQKGQTTIEYNIAFSELEFEQGLVSLTYKGRNYIYTNANIINYDKIIDLIYNGRVHEMTKNRIRTFLIRVVIDVNAGTFSFKDIDICKYVNNLKKSFLPKSKKPETQSEIRLSKAAKRFNVGKDAIVEFLTKKGFQVDTAPDTKLSADMYALILKEYQGEKVMKKTAKKLENFIEWGNDSSVDLPTKNDGGMVSVTEPANEENKNEEEIVVSVNKLHFGNNIISLKHNKIDFVSWEMGISMYLNSEKSINNLSTKILLNYSNLSFSFLDLSLLSSLKDLSTKLEERKKQEIIQKQIAKEAKEKKRLKKQKEKEEKEKKAKEKRQLRKEKGEPQKTEEKTVEKVIQKRESRIQLSALKTMMLVAGNIRFYNGYYLIFQTINGEVDNSVTPYRIDDPNSHEILNLVHKYFEQILEQKRIIVKYDETKILEPSRFDLFQLSNYVRDLKRNLYEKDVWWEEVQNARKRSFRQCSGEPTESVKKRVVKSKNEFLYNLSSLQNEKKLIRVYEINHGKEEDAFIFTISMSNNRCAIVFENASKDASTTTWIFVAKDEDYEPCINLVFDYFTDYTVSLKRSSLRSTINPPKKFKAESYAFIYHDDIGQWLKKLNKIIGQTPEPSDIQFVPGLHIPQSSETRTGHGETISTRHLHNQLMRKLYDKLCSESGKDNVGTEIRVGTKRIDTVVKGDDFYDIYEIKTADNPFECVTEALGQLCQYTYLFCRDKIGKMVIVGPSEMTKEVKDYLSWFRTNYSLQLYYMKV